MAGTGEVAGAARAGKVMANMATVEASVLNMMEEGARSLRLGSQRCCWDFECRGVKDLELKKLLKS